MDGVDPFIAVGGADDIVGSAGGVGSGGGGGGGLRFCEGLGSAMET